MSELHERDYAQCGQGRQSSSTLSADARLTSAVLLVLKSIAPQMGYHLTSAPPLRGFFLCAEHDRQLGGVSPLPSLMVASGKCAVARPGLKEAY